MIQKKMISRFSTCQYLTENLSYGGSDYIKIDN